MGIALVENGLGNVRFRKAQHYTRPRRCPTAILSSSAAQSGAAVPLKEVLGGLPPDIPVAIFVVLHIPATGIGVLATVASGAGKLAVRQAENGLPIENGHLYLAAPDRRSDAGHPRTWPVRPSIPSSAPLHCTMVRGSLAWC